MARSIEVLDHLAGEHDTTIKNHEQRIDKLEQDSTELKTDIRNLCSNLATTNSIMKWFIGLWMATLLGFFIWFIQSKM